MFNFLDREHSVAGPRYNRWLVPPSALAIHLSIGQVYAFSVFKLPLTKILGITHSVPGDWTQTQLAAIFSTCWAADANAHQIDGVVSLSSITDLPVSPAAIAA
jgi:hypothetical protein